jgi:hypothetical protein
MRRAVYNSTIPYMAFLPSRWLRYAGLLILVAWINICCMAADWGPSAQQLARKVAAATGPGAVALDFTNRSSLGRGDFDEIRRGITTELAASGLHFVGPEQAAVTVQISLSEDLQNYVWIAEIHQGNNENSVAMVSLPRPAISVAPHETSALTIHKTLLWTQDDRILDAAVIDGNPPHLAILNADHLSLYIYRDGRWQPEQSLPIQHSRPWPRDLRGRLVLRQDHLLDAFLPGVFCTSNTTAPLTLNCRESDDPWPIGSDAVRLSAFFASNRNFFTGVLIPGVGKQTSAPAFYSAATLPREKYVLALFASLDGQVHMLDGISDRATGKLGWGSDIASIHTECGSGWQILTTQAGAGPHDTIRAYEFPDREPVLVSQSVDFNGMITALWSESNGNTAVGVLRNSETGKYEAYRLNIACSQ